MTQSWQSEDKAGAVFAAPMAVVVAHPDDEALWLSSVLAQADHIVVCYGDQFGKPKKAAARRKAVAALPLPGLIDLAIPESGSLDFVDWAHPQLTQTGIAITDPATRARYDANYETLIEALRKALAGVRTVCTHNPWGEYGHPEHIQVHHAVCALQAELGYTIWFSNYIGAASWPLALELSRRPCWTQRRALAPDTRLAHRLARVYRRHGAWTWTRAHLWPKRECLYAVPPGDSGEPRHSLSGEGVLDVAGLRWWPPPWRAAHRRLG